MTPKLPPTTVLLKAVLEQIAPVEIETSKWAKYRWAAEFPHVEIGDGSTLQGLTGYGNTVPAAVRDLWFKATDLKPPFKLVVNGYVGRRSEWRWDDGRWQRLR